MKLFVLVVIAGFLMHLPSYAQFTPHKINEEKHQAFIDSLKRTEYSHLFPIWGDKVQKQGILLPLSAGISVNYLWQKSDLNIEDLTVGFNNGPPIDLAEVLRINSARSTANGVNLRPDLWVLPFLNVYGIVAVARTSTSIDAALWLPDSNNAWNEVTAFSSKVDFNAQTFGFGLTPTFGVRGYWVALDFNFAWSDISALKNPAFSFVFGPRIGKTYPLDDNHQKTLALWVGAFRLNLGSETSGSINLSDVLPLEGLQGKVDQGFQRVDEAQQQVETWWNNLSPAEKQNPVNKAKYERANQALGRAGSLLVSLDGALSNAEAATVQYSLAKSQAKRWNFIIGGQFQLNEHLMFRAEYGFLGARDQFIGGIQYRFGL